MLREAYAVSTKRIHYSQVVKLLRMEVYNHSPKSKDIRTSVSLIPLFL